jgi:hypothetical protein
MAKAAATQLVALTLALAVVARRHGSGLQQRAARGVQGCSHGWVETHGGVLLRPASARAMLLRVPERPKVVQICQ